MQPKPDLSNSSRLSFAIAGVVYLPVAFLLFHWINYSIGSLMGYPVSYSWRGTNMWCVNARPFQKAHPEVPLDHFFYIYWGAMIAWPLVGAIIYSFAGKLQSAWAAIIQWLGVIMIVTPLYHVVISVGKTFLLVIPHGQYHFETRLLVFYIVYLACIAAAIWVYRKSFQKEGKRKLWLITFPVFVLCWWLWFFEIGKQLLP